MNADIVQEWHFTSAQTGCAAHFTATLTVLLHSAARSDFFESLLFGPFSESSAAEVRLPAARGPALELVVHWLCTLSLPGEHGCRQLRVRTCVLEDPCGLCRLRLSDCVIKQ